MHDANLHVVHNTAQHSSDNLPSYPPDNHHSSDSLQEVRGLLEKVQLMTLMLMKIALLSIN